MGFVSELTVIRRNFHPIGAFSDLFARRTHTFIDAPELLRALRHFDVGRQLRSVASGRNEGTRYDDEPRPRDDPLLDCLLQADIGVTGAFCTEITRGCESGEQRSSRMSGRAANTQGK